MNKIKLYGFLAISGVFKLLFLIKMQPRRIPKSQLYLIRKALCCAGMLLWLAAFAGPAGGGIVPNLTLTDDRDGGDPDGEGVYDYLAPDTYSSVRAYVGWTGQPWPYDLRAAWEYSLAGIPFGATINSAIFTPKRDVANGAPGASFVTFHGYNGNGTVELPDVVSTDNPLVTWDMFSSSFASNITPFIQSLVNSSATHAGIMAQGLNGQIAFTSKENVQVPSPAATLVVDYTPSSTVLNVANNGIDSSSCGITSPCRSISQAIVNASPYDTIVVGPGLYGDLNGDGVFSSPGEEMSGDPARMIKIIKPLTVESRSGAGVTVLSAGGASLDIVGIFSNDVIFGKPNKGFTMTNSQGSGMDVFQAKQITIQANVAIGNRGNGFMGHGSSNVVLIGNTASDNQANGFFNDNGCNDYIYKNNLASRNYAGFEIAGSIKNTFMFNVTNQNTYGFDVWGNDHEFLNNTATGNLINGFEIRGSRHKIQSNVIVGNRNRGINFLGTPDSVINKNNIYGNSDCGLYNNSSKISARNNFWGAATGPGEDPADKVCGNQVIFIPFATHEF